MKKVTQILIFAFIGVVTVNTAKAQIYDPYAVQVINNLIANNGLPATPNAPETWDFAIWNDETPKQLIELQLYPPKGMKGAASFAGLTTLQTLNCAYNQLAKLDLTNCVQLQTLDCHYGTSIAEIVLTNCTQLQTLNCFNNKLSVLGLKNFKQLQTLICYANQLIEIDVTNCTQMQTLNCFANRLTKLNLTGLDKLTDFNGGGQDIPLTLYKNETGEYTCEILLNHPTFESNAISYSDGILKSTDTTVFYPEFTALTDEEHFTLRGILRLSYSNDLEIDFIDNVQLMVYPNPATGELIVTCNELQVISIEIYDVNGRKQKAENKKQKAESETIIDISHLPAGIYLIKIITEQGEINKKIVKQ